MDPPLFIFFNRCWALGTKFPKILAVADLADRFILKEFSSLTDVASGDTPRRQIEMHLSRDRIDGLSPPKLLDYSHDLSSPAKVDLVFLGGESGDSLEAAEAGEAAEAREEEAKAGEEEADAADTAEAEADAPQREAPTPPQTTPPQNDRFLALDLDRHFELLQAGREPSTQINLDNYALTPNSVEGDGAKDAD